MKNAKQLVLTLLYVGVLAFLMSLIFESSWQQFVWFIGSGAIELILGKDVDVGPTVLTSLSFGGAAFLLSRIHKPVVYHLCVWAWFLMGAGIAIDSLARQMIT